MAERLGSGIVNALTVDVEDYFQVSAFERIVSRADWPSFESRVAANTDRLLSVFADAGVRATFFVLGWVADHHPAVVKRIASGGHEIASHGYWHRLIYDQEPEEFREDLREAKSAIEAASGQAVSGYRAPSFSVTRRSLWALDILAEEGYSYDASIVPIHHDRYGIPSAPRHAHRLERRGGTLVEIPGSTVALGRVNVPIGGGGYFRLLPYSWIRWGIARVNRLEQKPAVFYLHPWEVDPAQPRLAAPWPSRVRHYRNLADTERRLRQLLTDFRFAPIRDTIVAPVAAAA